MSDLPKESRLDKIGKPQIEYRLFLDDEGFVYKKYHDLGVYIKYQNVEDYNKQSFKDGVFVREEIVTEVIGKLKECYWDGEIKIKNGYRFIISYKDEEITVTTDVNGLMMDGLSFRDYFRLMKPMGAKIVSQETI